MSSPPPAANANEFAGLATPKRTKVKSPSACAPPSKICAKGVKSLPNRREYRGPARYEVMVSPAVVPSMSEACTLPTSPAKPIPCAKSKANHPAPPFIEKHPQLPGGALVCTKL